MKLTKGRSLAFGALLMAGQVNAATIFAPTDGDVNFLLDTLPDSYVLAMFDDEDQTYTGTSINIPLPSVVGISGPNTNGDYFATNDDGDTLTLTNSNRFILGLYNGSDWLSDSNVIYNGANAYTVEFDVNGSVLAVDVQVVPVPAAVWLFGSGLLGLAGVARRKLHG